MKYLGTLPGEVGLKAKLFVSKVDKYCVHTQSWPGGCFLFRGAFRAGAEGPFPKKLVSITAFCPESDFDLKDKFLVAQVHLLPCHHL